MWKFRLTLGSEKGLYVQRTFLFCLTQTATTVDRKGLAGFGWRNLLPSRSLVHRAWEWDKIGVHLPFRVVWKFFGEWVAVVLLIVSKRKSRLCFKYICKAIRFEEYRINFTSVDLIKFHSRLIGNVRCFEPLEARANDNEDKLMGIHIENRSKCVLCTVLR